MTSSTTSPELYEPRYCEDLTPLAGIYEEVEKGSIRVVRVEGFDEHGLLDCLLLTQQFNKASYIAISYTWDPKTSIWYGAASETGKAIRINGQVVSIRSKVADILCLVHRLGKSSVWIDGLCINQEDPDDKRVQVNQMGQVYNQAEEVITVLGSPNADTDFLFDRDVWNSEALISQHFDRLHRTMLMVLANDYWRRAWVLQEMVLGKKVVLCCGCRVIGFDDLSRLFNRLQKLSIDWSGIKGVARTVKVLFQSNLDSNQRDDSKTDGGVFRPREMSILDPEGKAQHQGMNFLDLLHQSQRYNRCFDPKDMLYARRDLAKDGTILIPSTDYSPETSFEEVYKHFAKQCILTSSTGSLKVITYSNWYPYDGETPEGFSFSKPYGFFPKPVNIPSWVPDWRYVRDSWYAGVKTPTSENDNELLKLRWSDAPPTVSSDGNELSVQGRILSTITEAEATFFPRSKGMVTKAAMTLLYRYYPNIMPMLAPPSPVPEAGDHICVLKGCPAFVFLHKVDRSDKYQITGRYKKYQHSVLQHCLKEMVSCNQQFRGGTIYNHLWQFRDEEMVNGIPEQRFTIV